MTITIPERTIRLISRGLVMCMAVALLAAVALPEPVAARGSFSLHGPWSASSATAAGQGPAAHAARHHSAGR